MFTLVHHWQYIAPIWKCFRPSISQTNNGVVCWRGNVSTCDVIDTQCNKGDRENIDTGLASPQSGIAQGQQRYIVFWVCWQLSVQMLARATNLIQGHMAPQTYIDSDSKGSNNMSPLPFTPEMLGPGLLLVWQILWSPLTHPVSLRGGLESW